MRYVFIGLTVFIIAFKTNAQSVIKGNQYILDGKIINKVSLTPDCGVFAYAIVVEFQIIKFSDSSYSGNYIGLIVPCPEFYGKNFFQQGKKYKLNISDESQSEFDWLIPNKDILKKYKLKKLLWINKAEKI